MKVGGVLADKTHVIKSLAAVIVLFAFVALPAAAQGSGLGGAIIDRPGEGWTQTFDGPLDIPTGHPTSVRVWLSEDLSSEARAQVTDGFADGIDRAALRVELIAALEAQGGSLIDGDSGAGLATFQTVDGHAALDDFGPGVLYVAATGPDSETVVDSVLSQQWAIEPADTLAEDPAASQPPQESRSFGLLPWIVAGVLISMGASFGAQWWRKRAAKAEAPRLPGLAAELETDTVATAGPSGSDPWS